MNGWREPWRLRARVWVPALVLVAVNLVVLLAYQFLYAGNVRAGAGRLDRMRTELAELELEASTQAARLDAARGTRSGIQDLYGSRLTSERRRLTDVLAEVKRLAQAAGLEPAAIQYPGETLEDFGLVKRSLVFGVDGTYLELRTFVNFLEISDRFLVIEEIALSGSEEKGPELRINLKISTLFAVEGSTAGLTAGGGA